METRNIMKILIKNRTNDIVKEFGTNYEKGESVLNLLERLQETDDTSLAFLRECKSGKCGACRMRINGKERLACTEEVTGKDLYLAPSNYGIYVRDLLCIDVICGEVEGSDNVR